MLLATAVAVLLGMIAVLTKVSTHRLAVHGWHGLLTVPAPYLLVALAVTVTVLQQSAFHAGALQASVPIMLVGEPMVAVLLGVVILGEHLAVRGAGGVILALAVGAMTAATIALGRDSPLSNAARRAATVGCRRSGGVVKDQAERETLARAHDRQAVPYRRGRPAASRSHRPVAGGEQVAVALRQLRCGAARLGPGPLFDEHELPAGEFGVRIAEVDHHLKGKYQVPV